MLKKCRVCEQEKKIESFPVAKRNKDGHRNECKSCYAKYYREYYKKDPTRYKEKSKKQKSHNRHRISDEEYAYLINKHNGLCHLCISRPASVIDHDHNCCKNRSCGKCVRGVLCNNCNTAIGLLKEDTQTINRINEYITRRIGEQASRHSSKVQ